MRQDEELVSDHVRANVGAVAEARAHGQLDSRNNIECSTLKADLEKLGCRALQLRSLVYVVCYNGALECLLVKLNSLRRRSAEG